VLASLSAFAGSVCSSPCKATCCVPVPPPPQSPAHAPNSAAVRHPTYPVHHTCFPRLLCPRHLFLDSPAPLPQPPPPPSPCRLEKGHHPPCRPFEAHPARYNMFLPPAALMHYSCTLTPPPPGAPGPCPRRLEKGATCNAYLMLLQCMMHTMHTPHTCLPPTYPILHSHMLHTSALAPPPSHLQA
jgi:hypothetical protein